MRNLFVPLLVIILVIVATSVFTVEQGSRGVVLRFGKVITDGKDLPIVYEPGLHFKMPFIDNVKILDARIQTLSIPVESFITSEQKYVLIDSYIKWQINDFGLYYKATTGGVKARAEDWLQSRFNDRMRSAVGSLNIRDLVTDSRGKVMNDVRQELNSGININEMPKIVAETISTQVETANEKISSMAALGVDVIDVRIKQISLPPDVFEAIYKRMREERIAVAQQHRAQGKEQAEKNRALADYNVTKTIAEAEKDSRVIRGQADAEAAKIFSDAFSVDPEFYQFIRSLKAYEQGFKDKRDLLVLSPDSEFFRYMKSSTGTVQ